MTFAQLMDLIARKKRDYVAGTGRWPNRLIIEDWMWVEVLDDPMYVASHIVSHSQIDGMQLIFGRVEEPILFYTPEKT